jgi:release factor glutamine methyltransferase
MTNKEFLQQYSKIALQLNKEPSAIKELVLGFSRMSMQELILAYDQPVFELEKIEKMVCRYLYESYPIQYMVNEAHFYGLSFYVDERV